MKPPPASRSAARLDELAGRLDALRASDPDAALRLAIEVVGRERAHRVLEPALDLLIEIPRPSARAALRQRFLDLTENGMRYDQDCSLRVRIMRVLRALGSADDVDLAELGRRTVQLQPPGRIDVAQGLRGQSLLFLADVGSDRVDYYAVDLLHDPHLSAFSGEPAVTAIQVLAQRGQVLPIWAIARHPETSPDVLAQAFASLRRAPAELQLDALRGHLDRARAQGEPGEPIALVAAEAIVLNRLIAGYPAVLDLLRDTPNLNLYLALATTAVRADDPTLRAGLQAASERETNPRKRAVLLDLLSARLPPPRRRSS